MSILNVIQLKGDEIYSPNTTLRQKSDIVTDFGSSFQNDLNNVLETFYHWKIAVGISAPQLGIQKRIAIVNLNKSNSEETLILINPVVVSEAGKKDLKKESCLSIPNVRGEVERRSKIQIKYQDRNGDHHDLSVEGFLARVIMHEIDHLNGILFVDRMADKMQLEPLNIVWE